jgi:acetoin utilization deacetylase AcuC-like enzyme
MTTGIVRDWRYLNHDMGPAHPESPARIKSIYEMLEKEKMFSSFPVIEPRPASEAEVELIHTKPYFELIKQTAGKERVILDPDTSTSPRSYETALLAAGGLLKAAEMVLEGKLDNGFGLVRPPGHHAEASGARGFCIFNNVAVAAEHLIQARGLKRILIVDWDLHHGNGTQHSFEERDDVLYFSTHQYPHYPGSGHWSEVGRGKGEGFTVNVPLAPGKSDDDFLAVFERLLLPIARTYKPQFILVSAGFDIFAEDPLGGMEVSVEGFGALAAVLVRLARQTSEGRLLCALEGGYHLGGLSEGVKRVLLALGGTKRSRSPKPHASASTESELAPVFKTQKKYWPVET